MHKHQRNVTFQLTPSIINNRNSQCKRFKYFSYTSSEEGEVKEDHSDSNYILDDEKHRAKNDQSYRNFSCESEIYGEKINNLSPQNDGNIQINFRYNAVIRLNIRMPLALFTDQITILYDILEKIIRLVTK